MIEQSLATRKDIIIGVLALTDRISHFSSQQTASQQDWKEASQQLLNGIKQLRTELQSTQDLLPQVVLQKPVILRDACGKIAPFHLDSITSTEAFLAVLRARYKQAGVPNNGLLSIENMEFFTF